MIAKKSGDLDIRWSKTKLCLIVLINERILIREPERKELDWEFSCAEDTAGEI